MLITSDIQLQRLTNVRNHSENITWRVVEAFKGMFCDFSEEALRFCKFSEGGGGHPDFAKYYLLKKIEIAQIRS